MHIRGISAFWLKIIAIVAMTIAHVGFIFFPSHILMNAVGKLTFPIMSFLLVEGYRHTRDVKRYATRLFWFALLSVVPFYLAFGWYFNVCFTLLASLLALYAADRQSSKIRRFLFVLLLSILSLPCDWGFIGVWLTYMLYRSDNNKLKMVLSFIVFSILYAIYTYVFQALYYHSGFHITHYAGVPFLFGALVLILCYNGRRGYPLKYFFYLYYPLHLFVLWLIYEFMVF